MGQDTLGDHMHIQSTRSHHRACNVFHPLLDELLINARTVSALSESNGLHPARDFYYMANLTFEQSEALFAVHNCMYEVPIRVEGLLSRALDQIDQVQVAATSGL